MFHDLPGCSHSFQASQRIRVNPEPSLPVDRTPNLRHASGGFPTHPAQIPAGHAWPQLVRKWPSPSYDPWAALQDRSSKNTGHFFWHLDHFLNDPRHSLNITLGNFTTLSSPGLMSSPRLLGDVDGYHELFWSAAGWTLIWVVLFYIFCVSFPWWSKMVEPSSKEHENDRYWSSRELFGLVHAMIISALSLPPLFLFLFDSNERVKFASSPHLGTCKVDRRDVDLLEWELTMQVAMAQALARRPLENDGCSEVSLSSNIGDEMGLQPLVFLVKSFRQYAAAHGLERNVPGLPNRSHGIWLDSLALCLRSQETLSVRDWALSFGLSSEAQERIQKGKLAEHRDLASRMQGQASPNPARKSTREKAEHQIAQLEARANSLQTEKGSIRGKLKEFQENFVLQHHRKIRFHKDILPIEKEYRAYKNIKEELQKVESQLRSLRT
eukprot:s666_g7.t1